VHAWPARTDTRSACKDTRCLTDTASFGLREPNISVEFAGKNAMYFARALCFGRNV